MTSVITKTSKYDATPPNYATCSRDITNRMVIKDGYNNIVFIRTFSAGGIHVYWSIDCVFLASALKYVMLFFWRNFENTVYAGSFYF